TACAMAHLLLPASGDAPARVAARLILHVAARGGPLDWPGAAMLSAVVVWPAIAVAWGWLHARSLAKRPPARMDDAAIGGRKRMAVLAVCSLPMLLLPLATRIVRDPWGESANAAVALAGMAIFAAVLVALVPAISLVAKSAARRELLRSVRRPALIAIA